jgi:hypothetical protein
MSYENIHVKRDELYEQVWSQPMTELAKHYGLSDVGLAKICRRLKVPIPGRGYWAMKDAGRAPSRPALPALGENEESEAMFTRYKLPEPDPQQQSEAERLIAFEKALENRVNVGSTLDVPHSLVARTEKSLRTAKKDEQGLVRPHAKGCFDLRVAPASTDRALRLLDVLAKACEARNFPLVIEDNNQTTKQITKVTVLGITHEIALEETTDRKERELTPSQKKEQKIHPWMYRIPQYDYTPTGRLTLKIKGYGSGERRSWSDGKQQRLEDCLNAFLIGLIQVSVRERAQQLERERQEQAWKEQERRRQEEERRRRLEEARAKALEAQLAAWQQSQQVRTYGEAVRRKAIERFGSVEPGSSLDQWLTWTFDYADRIDPLGVDPSTFRLLEHKDVDPWSGAY